ncbi:MAG: hypothetical protein WB562_19910 [Candidatus Sulfotelmatobacter sp.]
MILVDWLGLGLMLSLVGAFVGAFFLYLRTAYRKGGWPGVKASFTIAIIALGAFYVVRVAENSDLQLLKDAVNRMTR